MDTRYIKEDLDIQIPKNFYEKIVDLQKELLKGYITIEKLPQYPLNLDRKEHQTIVKDFIARIIEELAEAFEVALKRSPKDQLFREELADALHFFIETLIYTDLERELPYLVSERFKQPSINFNPKDPITIIEPNPTARVLKLNDPRIYWDITYHLSLARNTLRNKPWKQTEVRVNLEGFKTEMTTAWVSFMYLFKNSYGFSNEDIFIEYVKKNKVNLWRQQSKY